MLQYIQANFRIYLYINIYICIKVNWIAIGYSHKSQQWIYNALTLTLDNPIKQMRQKHTNNSTQLYRRTITKELRRYFGLAELKL